MYLFPLNCFHNCGSTATVVETSEILTFFVTPALWRKIPPPKKKFLSNLLYRWKNGLNILQLLWIYSIVKFICFIFALVCFEFKNRLLKTFCLNVKFYNTQLFSEYVLQFLPNMPFFLNPSCHKCGDGHHYCGGATTNVVETTLFICTLFSFEENKTNYPKHPKFPNFLGMNTRICCDRKQWKNI